MCIYHEAVRLTGVRPQEALALAVLPGFEKGHTFLSWFYENPGSATSWQIAVLDALAVAAIEQGLLQEILALPEDQGNGPKALDLIRQALAQEVQAKAKPSSSKLPKSIFHEAMLEPALDKNLALAIAALPGYEIRKTCLDWYADNPGSSAEWQVLLLDKLAMATCKEGGLFDEVFKLQVGKGNASNAVALIRSKLGLSVSGASAGAPPARRTCCDG